MAITVEQVRQVARLARLDLSEADLVEMRPQLDAILDYVAQLGELDTEGVEPMAHPLPVQNAFRDDEPVPSLPTDEALRNAPVRIGDHFGVPAVFDSSGEMTP